MTILDSRTASKRSRGRRRGSASRSALFALAGLTCLFGASPGRGAGGESTPPNVIVVFIDDLGWSDLSCFRGERTATENTDRLASEGIRFTNFYVNSPICSPSRVALTTGQYPTRWQITSFLNHRRSNRERGVAQWLDPAAPTLPRRLRAAGYATGHFGKWHMGGQRDVDDAPPISAYGFDESLTNFEGMGPKLLPLTIEPGRSEPRKIWGGAVRLGGPVRWTMRYEITGGFVDAALDFIDRAQRDGKPFYVNLWPDDVHTPLFPPLDKWGDGTRARYDGVLDSMDEQLAALYDRVREDPELKDNTLLLFCSDNGPQHGAGDSSPLRGAKTWLYEGGVRSPLIVWGPGLVDSTTAGRVVDSAVFSAIDLNRALYEVCGASLPEGVELDGENVAETLLGRSERGREAPIFWRRPPDRPGFGHGYQEDNPDLAVRDGKWKYYVNYDGRDRQLYDLETDPGEEDNLAAARPEIVERLQRSVVAWNGRMPRDAGDPAWRPVDVAAE